MPPKTVKDKKKIENITNQLNNSVHILNHLSTEIESLMKINEVTRVVQKVKKMSEMLNQIDRLEKEIKGKTSLDHREKDKKNLISSTLDGEKKMNGKEFVETVLNAIVGSENTDGDDDDDDDSIKKNIEKVARRVNSNFSYIDEMIGLHKMARFLLFIFMFFFIGKTIDYIFDFFDINLEMGYTYFALYTIIFLLFVILPLRKSVFD